MSAPQYRAQVQLLVRLLPLVAAERDFALKGGTAINLFWRSLPRLSVDIDLTYLPVADRATSLAAIDAAMRRLAGAVCAALPGSAVDLQGDNGAVRRLLVRDGGVQVKIEVTPVLRGVVFAAEDRTVAERVEAEFGFAEARLVSFADLFAGKMVAALDRQHPRDLFDVRDLLATEGLTRPLMEAFLVYLVSHNRPMAEILDPHRLDITQEFERNFAGMTTEPVALADLVQAREDLVAGIHAALTDADRRFLLSVKTGAPDWDLIGLPQAAELPAVRWKLRNLDALPTAKREALAARLKGVLGL
ncbi:MAG TPA: nucleotidyl transferase AbiEii/AbiGii toxin family protein [Caulobacteraceae bacterium]|nr:nucleotidyl transferase AbiEii/AbiGii toxin family protein [Caulobacteraceae bacterium]